MLTINKWSSDHDQSCTKPDQGRFHKSTFGRKGACYWPSPSYGEYLSTNVMEEFEMKSIVALNGGGWSCPTQCHRMCGALLLWACSHYEPGIRILYKYSQVGIEENTLTQATMVKLLDTGPVLSDVNCCILNHRTHLVG
jgi:hypothetical protein